MAKRTIRNVVKITAERLFVVPPAMMAGKEWANPISSTVRLMSCAQKEFLTKLSASRLREDRSFRVEISCPA